MERETVRNKKQIIERIEHYKILAKYWEDLGLANKDSSFLRIRDEYIDRVNLLNWVLK